MRIQKPAELARLVKTRRQALGLTQQTVADSVGITRQSLARLERGHGGASFDTVLRIFETLAITLEAGLSRQSGAVDSAATTQGYDTTPLTAAALAAASSTEASTIAAAAAAASSNTDNTLFSGRRSTLSSRGASSEKSTTHSDGKLETGDARRAALRAAIEAGDPDRKDTASATETLWMGSSKGESND